MAFGEDKPVHSFFTTYSRLKTSEPVTSQPSDEPIPGPLVGVSSPQAGIIGNEDRRHLAEDCGNEQVVFDSNVAPDKACDAAIEQDVGRVEKAAQEQALVTPRDGVCHSRKRRKVDSAQMILSWDEQLRSHAQETSSKPTMSSRTADSTERLVEPHTRPQSSQTNGAHLSEENQGSPGKSDSPRVQDPGSQSNADGAKPPAVGLEMSKNPGKSLKFNSKGKLFFPGIPPSKMKPNKVKSSSAGGPIVGMSQGHLVAIIPYGKDEQGRAQISRRIDAILSTHRTKMEAKDQAPASKSANEDQAKALHPFFHLGDRRQTRSSKLRTTSSEINGPSIAPSPENVRTRHSSAATPGKLRAQAQAQAAHSKAPVAAMRFDSERDGRRPARLMGPPEALWPSKDMVHVRGAFSSHPRPIFEDQRKDRFRSLIPKQRKRKEGVIVTEKDCQQALKELPALEAFTTDPLKIPERLLIIGKQLQQLISKELYPDMADAAVDLGQELEKNLTREPRNHYSRFIQDFERLSTSLTPFDRGLRETEPWTQKYAPSSAEDVLQSGPEPMALREWLKTLAITAVDTGKSNGARMQPSRRDEAARVKRKKRKKRDDIDDFIVSTDDEDDMMEHADVSEHDVLQASISTHSKSIFRIGDLTSNSKARMTNAVLLSGPCGCGKTATVYAVAKELGFEVFELNAGSRRGGKELLEKVGDMAENHLYQSTVDDASNLSAEEDTARLGKALQKDLRTGRQGTMTSFFTAKPSSSPKVTKPTKTNVKKGSGLAHQQPKAQNPPKQKQSLILLEEVDILYEEDKQFWQSLITLAVSSKRPIIMTCNDESLVPLDSLNLHAILRCSPPSLGVAIDYLLLMAANEGHILKRSAVSRLFLSHKQDLRATIQQLDFWCQIGIGDRKGGLEWIYQRWPPGKDADADGNRFRVVSSNTYVENSSYRCPDLGDNELIVAFPQGRSEDVTSRVHVDCDSDVTDSRAMQPRNKLEALEDLDLALDVRSTADVICAPGIVSQYKVFPSVLRICAVTYVSKDVLDPTEPQIDDSARADYMEGYQLIQADLKVAFTDTGFQLSTYLTTGASLILVREGIQDVCSPSQFLTTGKNDSVSPSLYDVSHTNQAWSLKHADFLIAFECLTDPGPQAALQSATPGPSIFDGTMAPIIEDAAPYIRSIVAFDLALEERRLQLSNLVSQGGRFAKKARLTRASRSALEGGKRETTRRERWFPKVLNASLVLRTAGRDWNMSSHEPSQSNAPSRESSVA
ncbi:MAG: hypothetical protein Q9165_000881 [Trypethelium subeluteriae]